MADISGIKGEFSFPPEVVERFDKAICLGVRLSDAVFEEISDAPTKLYYYHYKTANVFLDQLTFRVSNILQDAGCYAMPIPASQIISWRKKKVHLSHKRLAELAGLGWVGRNNLIVNEKLGSRFRLASILTDMDIKADKPIENKCGSCVACISTCPAGAIKEDPTKFDHNACSEKLKEFHRRRLVGQYICGVCVKACKPLSPAGAPE